jgi:hypothetical protein
MAPVEASSEIPILCQKVKNKTPLTQRNLANRQLVAEKLDWIDIRTGLNGLRSELTATQNIARQL